MSAVGGMAFDNVVIDLRPEQFGEAERVLATAGSLTASTFRFGSGVLGLRLRNELGGIVLLPFQGQQIWDAEFFGRPLTMRSMFDEPQPTQEYLRTYGAFFIHCGATAMGNPGPSDTHPLHGELPNAPFRDAQLVVGRDADGAFMALTGTYRHTVAFSHNYIAAPVVRLTAGSSRLRLELSIRNLRHTPMELMYLAHVNFRPVDGATLVDAVPDDLGHIRIRTNLPLGFTPSPKHRALLEALHKDPGLHRKMDPEIRIDPELVMALDYRAGESGWAHSMQILPDGSADFVSHKPGELGHVVRWLSRNADQDALGLCLPATAEADGYVAEKAKGNIRLVPALGEFRCSLEFGALDPEAADAMRRGIEALRNAPPAGANRL